MCRGDAARRRFGLLLRDFASIVAPVRAGLSPRFSRSSPGRRTRTLLVAIALVSQGGCALMSQSMFGLRIRDCDGFETPLSALAGPSRKELRVKIKTTSADYDLPFVVESDPTSFVLVGFTPLGTKSFTLVRKGDEDAEIENLMGPVQAVPPENIMADVLAMSVPSQCAQYADGVVPVPVGKFLISDTCKDSRPLERRITRVGKPAGEDLEVVVEYLPDGIAVRQKHCGYMARYVLQATAPPPEPKPAKAEKPKKGDSKKAKPAGKPAAEAATQPAAQPATAPAPGAAAAPGAPATPQAPAAAPAPAAPAATTAPAKPTEPAQPAAPETAPPANTVSGEAEE